MDIKTIVKVTSKAWALDILATLHQGTPARRAALVHATGAGRTALSASLHHLLELELLETNPGHGHPLRPEFRLTAQGKKVASMAHKVKLAALEPSAQKLLRKVWTLPILAVSKDPRYFVQIKSALPSITDRALSQSLKQLQAQRLVVRKVQTQTYPPRTQYHAVHSGEKISSAVGL